MKRHYAILLAVLVFVSCTHTHDYTETSRNQTSIAEDRISETEIPVEEAVAALNRFLDSVDPVTRGGRRRTIARIDRVSAADMFPATTRSDSEMFEVGDLLYVVNFSNDEGYAVLGADSRLDTILIVGDNGSFDSEILHSSESGGTSTDSVIESLNNPELGTFDPDLGGGRVIPDSLINSPFTPQITPELTEEDLYCEEEDEYYIGSTSLTGVEGLIGDMLVDYTMRQTIWVGEKEVYEGIHGAVNVIDVAPMLKTNWRQTYPFNNHVPYYSTSGGRCPIGCTTTAACQILVYRKDIDLATKFGITNSSWVDFENFKDSRCSLPNVLEQDLAKFSLCVADGIGVKYSFLGKDGTFALPVQVQRYLKRLGYDVDRIIGFDTKTQHTIASSLNNNCPVFIGALNKKACKKGGHAWVIDGCKYHIESHNYFNHCNFGWGGKSNGWYYYKLFNSNDSGVDLDNDNDALKPQTFNYTWWFRILIIK